MEKTAYLDTTVFTRAILDSSNRGELAKDVLTLVVKGKLNGFTATLTFDEVFWKIRKVLGHKEAVDLSRAFLTIPNLQFVSVDFNVIWSTQELLERIKLAPRDAIHASSALSKRIKNIISEDSDFDKIPELKRISLDKFKN